jgi:hypothetical protein
MSLLGVLDLFRFMLCYLLALDLLYVVSLVFLHLEAQAPGCARQTGLAVREVGIDPVRKLFNQAVTFERLALKGGQFIAKSHRVVGGEVVGLGRNAQNLLGTPECCWECPHGYHQ